MEAEKDISACTNQVLRFFRCLDERQYEAMAAILNEDAVWYRQGKTLQGPAATLEALAQRSTTMRIVHVITNLMVERLQASDCVMRGYMLIVRHEPGCALSGPAPLNGIESIRDLKVELTQRNNQWRIKALSAEDVLFAQNK